VRVLLPVDAARAAVFTRIRLAMVFAMTVLANPTVRAIALVLVAICFTASTAVLARVRLARIGPGAQLPLPANVTVTLEVLPCRVSIQQILTGTVFTRIRSTLVIPLAILPSIIHRTLASVVMNARRVVIVLASSAVLTRVQHTWIKCLTAFVLVARLAITLVIIVVELLAFSTIFTR
jgi:hypothetical protein